MTNRTLPTQSTQGLEWNPESRDLALCGPSGARRDLTLNYRRYVVTASTPTQTSY